MWLGSVGIAVIAVVAVFWVILQLQSPDTTIKQASAVTNTASADSQATKVVSEDDFSFNLPSGWKTVSHEKATYDLYHYSSGDSGSNQQFLDIYQDTIPQNFSVNRVIGIEASVSRINIVGTISDNCADFTKAATTPSSFGTLAKWRGIDFLCDLANYERNVVGTSSQGNINSVTLTDSKGAARKYFFTYTDHNINPDYKTFFDALTSFTLK
ncbi:MAG: hypothetical protein JWM81_589 [Candidatus Saccharibacteria bacterium]|nr:hypothetical protein [Candidatus Saccharibacteria bacterium]